MKETGNGLKASFRLLLKQGFSGTCVVTEIGQKRIDYSWEDEKQKKMMNNITFGDSRKGVESSRSQFDCISRIIKTGNMELTLKAMC